MKRLKEVDRELIFIGLGFGCILLSHFIDFYAYNNAGLYIAIYLLLTINLITYMWETNKNNKQNNRGN